jgi:hypothetical protein
MFEDNLQRDGCSYSDSNLNDDHEEQCDDEAAKEGLAALAHADDEDKAG